MEKHKLLRRGVYKKAKKRKSTDSTIKRQIRGVQEIIGQLQDIRSSEKFQFRHEEDLRPRLRKSMLIRELQNVEKNIISSTPHHTKDPHSQQFFGKNLSVFLSPISSGSLSTEKNETGNNGKIKNNGMQKAALQKNSEEVSNEIGAYDGNNLPLYVGIETDEDNQKTRKSLRQSEKYNSLNRSKIENKSHNTVNDGLRSLKADTCFKSHEHTHITGTDKSPEKKLVKTPVMLLSARHIEKNLVINLSPVKETERSLVRSPGESSSAPKTVFKKSKIPLRTASQERALEVNNNLETNKNLSLNKNHGAKSTTPKKKAQKTCLQSPNRKKAIVKEVFDGPSQVVLSNSPDRTSRQDGNKENNNLKPNYNHSHDQNDNESYIINISSSNSSSRFEKNDKSADLVRKRNSINTKNDLANCSDSSSELHHDRTEFVNKTPRRRNYQTFSSQITNEAVCNKNANIPIILTEAHSPCEKANIINKSRASAVRCKPADRCEAVGEVLTTNFALSPVIGRNKGRENGILQHTRLESSIGVQMTPEKPPDVPIDDSETTLKNVDLDTTQEKRNVDKDDSGTSHPLSTLVAEIVARKTAIDREIQTDTPKEKKREWTSIIAEISAKKQDKCKEKQTSIGNSLRPLRSAARKNKFVCLEERKPQTPAVETLEMAEPTPDLSNTVSFSRVTFSDTASSSGRGSDFAEAVFNLEEDRNSRWQIFESLEEENTLDGLNFSQPDDVEQFYSPMGLRKPWRFMGESLVPELAPVQSAEGYSYNNEDSNSSSFCPRNRTLRSWRTTASKVPKDIVLTRSKKRQYDKKILKVTNEIDQPGETINSLTPETFYNENVSLDGKSSPGIQNNGQIATIQQYQQSEIGISEKSAKDTLTKRHNKNGQDIVSLEVTSGIQNNGQIATIQQYQQSEIAISEKSAEYTLTKKHYKNGHQIVSLEGTSGIQNNGQTATTHRDQRQSETVISKKSSKETSPKYNKKCPKRNQELVRQSRESVPSPTRVPEQTLVSQARNKENVSLNGANVSLMEHQSPQKYYDQQSESVLSKRAAEETFVSKASKRSRSDNRNGCLANHSFSSTENMIVSLSSADQQLLGIRPLSEIITDNKKTGSSVIDKFNAGDDKVSSKSKKSSHKRELIPEVNNKDSERDNEGTNQQENIQHVENTVEMVAENNIDRSSPPFSAGRNKSTKKGGTKNAVEMVAENNIDSCSTPFSAGRNKSTKKRGTKNAVEMVAENNIDRSSPPLSAGRNKSTKKRETKKEFVKLGSASGINPHNILPASVDGGRPQRNRKPARLLVDIILDENALLDWYRDSTKGMGKKARKGDSSCRKSERSKKAKNSDGRIPASKEKKGRSISKQTERPKKPKKGQTRRPNKIDKNLSTQENDVPEENVMDNIDNAASEEQEERSPERRLGNCDGSITTSEQIENEPISKKAESTKKGKKGRPKKGDKQVLAEINHVSEENDMEKTDNVQGEISAVPVTSQERCLDENSPLPSCHKQLDKPMENESMPPPKGNGMINSTHKIGIRRNLTGDSGFDTINNISNSNRKDLGKHSKKKTKNRTKEPEQNTNYAEESVPEDIVQSENNHHLVPEESLSNSRLGSRTTLNEQNEEQVASQRLSDSSRNLEQSTSSVQKRMTSFQLTNNEYLNYIVNSELYSLKFANNVPSDTDYTRFGNLEVTQSVKYPQDTFSAGHIRLQPGCSKRPTITTKYSFIYNVMKGVAWVQCNSRTSTISGGGFFVIPVGMEYSIQNIDPQAELLMSYTKVKMV